MSWIWGSDATAEQANMVVMSLQGELDERQATIEVLVKALKKEKEEYKQALVDEVHDLRERKQALQDELAHIDALISAKTQQITLGDKPKPKVRATVAVGSTASPAQAAATSSSSSQPTSAPVDKPRKKKAAPITKNTGEPEAEASVQGVSSTIMLPTHPELLKVRGIDAHSAFIIQRSNNANTVVYKGNVVAPSNLLDPKTPLHIYWIMFALPGHPTEELNVIERNTAYGATATATSSGEFDVALASLKDRRIAIFVDASGHVRARTTVDGKPNVYLERVFVQSTTSWGLPKVEYVEIFAVDPVTHEQVYEKKFP
ncbi:hypothetical protein H257_01212 [Aphanomyces astaci]|nr:hypothetical protein H257_01212 [Aphanomyces astaci]ETV87740.1 hypothetical protein H257_01212 [Aphanomyces astaci]|eukprot:XP_009822603.1 hypothetical protein H257_01212 [Aphanomyces astaci]